MCSCVYSEAEDPVALTEAFSVLIYFGGVHFKGSGLKDARCSNTTQVPYGRPPPHSVFTVDLKLEHLTWQFAGIRFLISQASSCSRPESLSL